jgi:hypothetical protein
MRVGLTLSWTLMFSLTPIIADGRSAGASFTVICSLMLMTAGDGDGDGAGLHLPALPAL